MTLFEDLLRGLLRSTPSGVWQQDYICVPARSDIWVPHIHGRVPDVVELGDLPIPVVGEAPDQCVTFSRWFDPLVPLATAAIPADEQRPLGAPLIHAIKASATYIIVRNWHNLEHSTRLLSMVRLGPMEFEESVDKLTMLGVGCDFTGTPRSGASPLSVQFTDLTTFVEGDYSPAGWDWDFGDATPHSNAQHPKHTYNGNAGDTFDVTLTVTYANGETCTITKEEYISLT